MKLLAVAVVAVAAFISATAQQESSRRGGRILAQYEKDISENTIKIAADLGDVKQKLDNATAVLNDLIPVYNASQFENLNSGAEAGELFLGGGNPLTDSLNNLTDAIRQLHQAQQGTSSNESEASRLNDLIELFDQRLGRIGVILGYDEIPTNTSTSG